MLKLQRNYRADISIGSWSEKTGKRVTLENVVINYPVSCKLQIDVGTYATANTGTFQFINLSRITQAKLWLDNFERGKKWVHIKFYAGYNDTMPLVYEGEAVSCLSTRPSGSTEWITELQTFNNGDFFKYGYINITASKDTTLEDILNLALKEYPNLKLGYITPDIPPLPRNKTFIGQTWDVIGREYGGYDVFIDQFGNFNILGDNDVIPGQVQVIADSTGLLGTPRRSNVFVELDTIFEPQLRTGQAISLISRTMPRFNQSYKIINVKHQGIISPVISDKLITTVTLAMMLQEPRELTKSTGSKYTGEATTGIWQKPVQGQITSPYGYRKPFMLPNGKQSSSDHDGIDIGAGYNTPVYAPANGRVSFAGWYDGYGKCIRLDNGIINGKEVTSLFGHLNQFLVSQNQNVYKGQQIGLVGSTGNSNGPHLHFSVFEDTKAVNPINYIGNY